MVEENISQEFRLKNIDETRNYFVEEIQQNELMGRVHKKVCATLNYIEHFLILSFTITGCISISVFASLLVIPAGIMSYVMGLKIYAVAAGIKSVSQQSRKKISRIKYYC